MDQMVLRTQQWLNRTYGGKTGYGENISENGNTGWTTIYALTRALQIELGITATANNFGPSTISRFNARFPNGVQQQDANDETQDNIYGIIQGACWCKGYSTGASDITTNFYSGTGRAIKELKEDAGCSDSSSTVTLNVMKALLSMDQFKLVSGGNTKIQQIQRNLNGEYEDYIGLSPCDGLYGRAMNTALIKVLQAIEGLTPEEANGNFGPTTRSNLPIIPYDVLNLSQDVIDNAVLLGRYALCCNGYEDVKINTKEWNDEISNVLKQFQADLCIEQTGALDENTWMALLVSTGNPSRECEACDTRFEMTDEVLSYIKNNGYNIVGRYLTGGDFKELRTNEARKIINSGIKMFPIFQESGADMEYFKESRGKIDAKNAVIAARKQGIPEGTIIYFAVDTDPTDPDISEYILPYFKGVKENIGQSYKVGVYGTRNVCTQVIENGYAETCFVSDMSTGFSGNMGFKIPTNWNLDQFHEIKSITVGNGTIDLDKVAYSGRYPVVETVHPNILDYTQNIEQLETLYLQYKQSKNENCSTRELILGITNFFRQYKGYNAGLFKTALGEVNEEFVNYVKTQNINLYNNLTKYANSDDTLLGDIFGGFIDISHMFTTIEGYLQSTFLIPNFWYGWGGDLASFMQDVEERYDAGEGTRLEIAKKWIGEHNTSFGYADICSDADAIKISEMLENSSSTHPVSDVFNEYYLNQAELRISYYLNDLNNVSLDLSNLKTAIFNKMSGIFENTVLIPFLGVGLNADVKNSCCEAFAQYIIDNYPSI